MSAKPEAIATIEWNDNLTPPLAEVEVLVAGEDGPYDCIRFPAMALDAVIDALVECRRAHTHPRGGLMIGKKG